MTSPSIEAEFEQYRATGSPDALGRVFDGVAPGLLCVASQLATGHAEDVLQETFLTAIARRESWDSRKPLRPWLVGILAHEVQRMRRRERRKVDPDRLELPTPPEPPDVAATAELARKASDAIEELPASFRQVCVLRLVHGLEPVQIARSLGIPTATVRTRLHRALARLRGALPAGVASGLAVLLQSGDLSAARAAVLRSAQSVSQPIAASTVSWTLGSYMMKKKLLAVVSVLVLLAVVTIGFPASPPDDVPQSTSTVVTSEASSEPSRATLAASTATDTVTRTAFDPRGDLSGRVFSGQVLGDERGALRPLAGASVCVFVSASTVGNEIPLGTVETDAVGRFELATDGLDSFPAIAAGGFLLTAQAEHAGWIPRICSINKDEAEIVLQPARGEVAGRVVDSVGRPVAGAQVSLHPSAGDGNIGIGKIGFTGRQLPPFSRPDGTFRMFYEGTGDFILRARSIAHGVHEQPIENLDGESCRRVGDLRLEAAFEETLTCRLVLGDRSPLDGIGCSVSLVDHQAKANAATRSQPPSDQRARWTQTSATSDADGRVVIRGLYPGDYLLEVDGWQEPFQVTTGTPEANLQVDGQLITLRMLDPAGDLLTEADLSGDRWPGTGALGAAPTMADRPEPESFAESVSSGSKQVLSPFDSTWVFLGVRRGGAMPCEAAHEVWRGVSRAQVDLRMVSTEAHERGSVRLTVLDAAGEEVTPVRVHALLPLSRWEFQDAGALLDPTAGLTLPAGPWSLVIDAGPLVDGVALLPRILRDITVTRGSQQEVVIWAGPPTGILELQLAMPQDQGARAIEQVLLHLATGTKDCTNKYRQHDAQGEYEEQQFARVVDPTAPFFLPPIPPGAGELEIHVTGCEPLRQRFVVAAGRVTQLDLTLRAVR